MLVRQRHGTSRSDTTRAGGGVAGAASSGHSRCRARHRQRRTDHLQIDQMDNLYP